MNKSFSNKRLKCKVFVPLLLLFILSSCQPFREFHNFEKFEGELEHVKSSVNVNPGNTNIAIVADTAGTEIFDLLGPYYLFNSTGKANVVVVAQSYAPVVLMKGLNILPQATFKDYNENYGVPDVIIIPNLSTMDEKSLDNEILEWIKTNYTNYNMILAVCDGSLTAAATGIYDGKLLTTHASDLKILKDKFEKPLWVSDQAVTQDGNLYSTAGVSNAVEGSLVVIRDLMGEEVMVNVMKKISYPYNEPQIQHNSDKITFRDKLTILNKTTFKGNKKVGVYIENNVSEFNVGALLDAYYRTFPKSLKSYSIDGLPVTSEYGLIMLPTGKLDHHIIDELHYVTPLDEPQNFNKKIGEGSVISHNLENEFIFNHLLSSIEEEYGARFERAVKRLLDYSE